MTVIALTERKPDLWQPMPPRRLDPITDLDAFLASIPQTPWFEMQSTASPSWEVYATREDAIHCRVTGRNLRWLWARDESGHVARANGRDAAWQDAGTAAWNAVRLPGIGDGPWAAAQWDAAKDASLLARVLACGDGLNEEHVRHAQARWDVWRRGYGLLCDLDGAFVVYRQPKEAA